MNNIIDLVLGLVNTDPTFCDGKYNFSAKIQREAGSNCTDSVVLIDPDGRTRDCFSISQFVYGGGTQCSVVAGKWHGIQARLGLPEEFTWETAILVAAARTWSPHMLCRPEALLSAWAYVLSDPHRALGIPAVSLDAVLDSEDSEKMVAHR